MELMPWFRGNDRWRVYASGLFGRSQAPSLHPMEKTPSYLGSGLGNLVAELELRLTGDSPTPGLGTPSLIPDARTYVLVLLTG